MKKFYLLAAILSFALNSYSQWSADPAINTPVCTTLGTQQLFPQLVPDGEGGAFITWMETALDLSNSRIYAQHLSSTGVRLWNASGIEVSPAGSDRVVPQIISDGNGGAIVSWISIVGTSYHHFVQRISSSGQIQWNPAGIEVCAATTTQISYYQLISDNQGGVIVLWDDQRDVQNRVYAQRIDAGGNLLWPIDGLACSPLFTNMSIYDAVADSTGGLMLCWTITTGLQSRNDVFVQHFSGNGLPLWGANGINICSAIRDQLYCKMVKDSLDNIIVIWQDFKEDPVKSQIYGQRIASDGTVKWQADGVMIADNIVPASTVAKIVTDTSRGAIISWLDDFPPVGQSTTAHLFAARIDSMGNSVWAPKEIATWTDFQIPTDFEFLPDYAGGSFISWGTPTSAGGPYEVVDLYAQHVLQDGTLQWPLSGQVVSSAPMSQIYQQMVSDSSGVAILAWSDFRNMADADLYATLLTPLAVLPVTWLNFSGIIQGSATLLSWETQNETNNRGFTIQRSPNGISFENIGFVPASTQVQDRHEYAFTDPNPHAGSNYYRLVQTDIDGKTAMSPTIRLNFDLTTRLSVFPNPASMFVTVRGSNAGSLIGLYGVDGRKYKEMRSAGGDMKLDVSVIASGLYIVRVIEGKESNSFLLTVGK